MQIQLGNDDIDFSKLIEFEWSSTQMQSQYQNSKSYECTVHLHNDNSGNCDD